MESVSKVLSSRKRLIIIITVIVAVVALGLSFIQPLKYSAEVRLLVTQRSSFNLDPYTAIRSTELISEHLARLVSTSSFLDRILESGYKIDKDYFAVKTEQGRRRLWSRTIDASAGRGTGLLNITAYHPKKDQAMTIVAAVSFLLSTQGGEYVGRDINIRLVDAPLVSRFPVVSNILLNGLGGLCLGLVIGSGWVWVEHRKRKHHGHIIG